MFPTTWASLWLVLLFLVPGFITRTVISRGLPRRDPDAQAWLAEVLTFSAISVLLFTLLYGLGSIFWHFSLPDLNHFPPKDPPILVSVVLYCTFFLLVPVLLGIAVVSVVENQWHSGLLEKLFKIHFSHPTPRAWDDFFHRHQKWGGIVVVMLSDGKRLAGYMAGDSFASSFPAPDDIFLERQMYVSAEGVVTGKFIPNTAGIWISGSQILYMEFFDARPKPKVDELPRAKEVSHGT